MAWRVVAAAAVLAGVAVGAGPVAARGGAPAPATVSPNLPLRVGVVTTALRDPYAAGPGPGSGRARPLHGCSRPASARPAGEGVVAVTLAAPGTSWASARATSLVVDVAVDAGPAQQVVLFAGARPFTYSAFVGSLAGGEHCVRIAVRPDLSADRAGPARAQVYDVRLGIVTSDSPGYLLESHAPVLYGRSTAASGDTPLLTYAQQTHAGGGTVGLDYVVVYSHEDVGTGLVPADEWGSWGRMTDIETVLHETVDARTGVVRAATYLSCGCEALPAYPDDAPEIPPRGETDQPFTGRYVGLHAVLRDATGNNDISPSGTTRFRFQQSLVAAPVPGQLRDAVMDAHPWTYQVSNDELMREDAAEHSTDPRTILVGDYRQYAVVDVDAAPQNASSVSIELRLRGDATWYSNDYEQATGGIDTTYPFYAGGHRRTVVKLPMDWLARGIAEVRLRLNQPLGSSAPPTLGLRSLDLIGLTGDWALRHPAHPAPLVTTGRAVVPTAVG